MTEETFPLANGHVVVANDEKKSVIMDLGNGSKLELQYGEGERPAGGRQCGSCSLCCTLLPVPPIGKPGGQRCKFARFRQGGCCTLYRTDRFPAACGTWSCRWLIDPDLKAPRPDRAHYVVDILPDFVQVTAADGRKAEKPVLQIWVDPAYPDAHRDPRLRAWIADNALKTGMGAIVRSNVHAGAGLLLGPPATTDTGEWVEFRTTLGEGVGLWSRS